MKARGITHHEERFWSKIDRTGGCWLWTSALDWGGYGVYWLGDGISRRAHRLAYECLVGPIPPDLTLDHLCRVRECVNPTHLEPVTRGENARRAPNAPYWRKARQTECLRGHEYTPENTYVRSHGRRECRKCMAARSRARRANDFRDGLSRHEDEEVGRAG